MAPNEQILKGHHKLARQIAGAGAFAEVGVWVYPARANEARIWTGFAQPPQFSAGAIFGASHALEMLSRFVGVTTPHFVEIREMWTTLVDTTEAFVAYAAARAVFDAFGIESEPMTIDPETRAVVIPSIGRLEYPPGISGKSLT